MIRCFWLLLVAILFCIGVGASAADLPSVHKRLKPGVQNTSPKLKNPIDKPLLKKVVAKPAKTIKKQVAVRSIVSEPGLSEMELDWVLTPLVASADGPKQEGSASVQGNLVVLEPGYVTSPYMIIELEGHIVKTAGSIARIDINIAGKHRKVTWENDEIESGVFKISLNETVAEGELPAYFPVSALAFVSKTTKGAVVLLSLEKICVRVGNVRLADSQ